MPANEPAIDLVNAEELMHKLARRGGTPEKARELAAELSHKLIPEVRLNAGCRHAERAALRALLIKKYLTEVKNNDVHANKPS